MSVKTESIVASKKAHTSIFKNKDKKERVRLTGGFVCELTAEEEANWCGFIITQKVWSEFLIAQSIFEITKSRGATDVGSLRSAIMSYLNAYTNLYDAGKSWYTNLREEYK